MRLSALLLALSAGICLADEPTQPAASEAEQKMPRVVMARVGQEEITVDKFMRFIAKSADRVPEATTRDGKARLLRVAIENELIKQAMISEGLINAKSKPEERQAAFLKFSNEHFPLPAEPGEAELRAYYDTHRAEFGIPASVRLSQIQIRVKKTASPEEREASRKRAEAALAQIESGVPFEQIAADITENPRAKANKGDVGFVWRYGDPWLEKAIDGVTVGQHTGVLESPAGYDILKVTDAHEAVTSPFEEVRETIAKKLQGEAQDRARSAYVKQLASRTTIEIVADDLKDAYPNGVFP